MTNDIIHHYDLLIDEGNDPVYDSEQLQVHMDKWDGKTFIDAMGLSSDKKVLEIGVGTGRLAVKIAPLCAWFTGIDISPKTIEKAKINLASNKNITLVCSDFISADIDERQFDVIYSSLTFMHISNKLSAMKKVSEILKDEGIFVLSIEKNQEEILDYGTRSITIYPDTVDNIQTYATAVGMVIDNVVETEFANIIILKKACLENAI